MKKKTVCVIGLGYIGLPTAALLANKGFSVVGVDVNEEIVSTINKGKIHMLKLIWVHLLNWQFQQVI